MKSDNIRNRAAITSTTVEADVNIKAEKSS